MSRDFYAPFDASDTAKPPSNRSASQSTAPFNRYAPYVEPTPDPKPEPEKLEIEPRNEFLDEAAKVAAGAAGAGVGTGLRYRSGMFGPEAGSKFMLSRPGMGVDQLSQFRLGTQPGQITEEARRNLQDLLAKMEGAGSVYSQEGRVLRESLERAIANLPEASMERNIAIARLAELGGIKAPPVPPLVSLASSGGDDIVNRIQSATTSAGQPVSGLSRAMGQHEYEMQAKMLRDAGVRTVDDLARMGIVDRNFAQYMVDNGMLLPTQEGRVLVRPQVLMGESGQPISAEDTAARQAAADAEARQAAARRQAEILRAQEVERARMGLRSTARDVSTLESTIPKLAEKLNVNASTVSPDVLKLDPNVRMAQEALLDARAKMPSTLGYGMHGLRRALPLAGGALSGAMTGASALDAYQRSQKGDPIGSAIAGATTGLSAASLYPPLTIPAGLGALGMEGVMYLYDKFGPSILPQLEKKGLIPRNFNPANYSVMDQN
jgi:hypothetical protein